MANGSDIKLGENATDDVLSRRWMEAFLKHTHRPIIVMAGGQRTTILESKENRVIDLTKMTQPWQFNLSGTIVTKRVMMF